jgi:hypothetical protein
MLNNYFIHDDTINNIQYKNDDKLISFAIENFIESSVEYKKTVIVFQNISNLNCSNPDFIFMDYEEGLDILTFDLIENECNTYFKLILSCGFGKQDVCISFNYDTVNVHIRSN